MTGGNNPHGIGAATAMAFAAEGAAVFIQYYRSPLGRTSRELVETPGKDFYLEQQDKSADDIVRAIRERGGKADACEGDLADPTLIPRLFDEAERAFGAVDVLINNAAVCDPDTFVPQTELAPDSLAVDGFPMSTITAGKHDHHFAVNSRAVALAMAEYARRFVQRRARWGRIVNVSTDGASGFGTSVSYGASKHALESYSRAAAGELGKYHITVNVVSLGPIQTGWITNDMEKAISAQTPLGRVGQPEDVADVIVFLSSEQARWITGQMIYVGGGWRMPL